MVVMAHGDFSDFLVCILRVDKSSSKAPLICEEVKKELTGNERWGECKERTGSQ